MEKVTVSKSPSDSEIVLTITRNNSRGFLERDKISAARKQLDLLNYCARSIYALARSLAISQAHVPRAHDEIKMATSRLRLRENEDDMLVDALSPEELDTAIVENSGEDFLAMDSSSPIKGQLRYLKDPNILVIASRMPRLRSLKRLEVFAAAGRTTLLYYRSLIKASPKLCGVFS